MPEIFSEDTSSDEVGYRQSCVRFALTLRAAAQFGCTLPHVVLDVGLPGALDLSFPCTNHNPSPKHLFLFGL